MDTNPQKRDDESYTAYSIRLIRLEERQMTAKIIEGLWVHADALESDEYSDGYRDALSHVEKALRP